MRVEKRAKIIIHGHVQGVFFRASARQQAQRRALKGFVRNLHDGSVQAVVQGDAKNIQEFIEWCHHGPEMASVDEVVVQYEAAKKSEQRFRIV